LKSWARSPLARFGELFHRAQVSHCPEKGH
jgi:hypothetical protein